MSYGQYSLNASTMELDYFVEYLWAYNSAVFELKALVILLGYAKYVILSEPHSR